MNLPPLHFSDILVKPTEPEKHEWQAEFGSSYFVNWKMLWDDIAQQEKRMALFTEDIGFGADSMTLLAGLAPKVSQLRRWIGLQKIPETVALIRAQLEADPQRKIVVWACHRCVMTGIRDRLKDFGAVQFYEGTDVQKRITHMRKFTKQKTTRVAVAAHLAATAALDFSHVTDVWIVEPDWNPQRNQASIMRSWNGRQAKKVYAKFVGMEGSIDRKLCQILKARTRALMRRDEMVSPSLEDDAPAPLDIFS